MKPPWKWVGGKTQLLPELRKHIPKRFGSYFEPFVGGGALFFDLQSTHETMSGAALRCTLNDSNAALIDCYRQLRDSPDRFIKEALGFAKVYNEAGLDQMDYYYHQRDHFNSADVGSPAYRAALFLFLNKCGFNGIFRVNRDGKFNVPWGKREKFEVDEENILACSAALHGVMLDRGDFEISVERAKRGDFVYFDCPYIPVSATSNFAAYQKEGFYPDDQVRLRDCARALKGRGVHVLLSNSDTLLVRQLYECGSFNVERVEARRNINSKGSKRGKVGEVLIW